MSLKAILRFDGCCLNNGFKHNQASYGYVLKNENSEIIAVGNGKLKFGAHTTNTAEFEGLLHGIVCAKKHNVEELRIIGDSQLVINWMKTGLSQKPHIQFLICQAKDYLMGFKKVSFEWQRRDNNYEADALANEALSFEEIVEDHLVLPILDEQPVGEEKANLRKQAIFIMKNWHNKEVMSFF